MSDDYVGTEADKRELLKANIAEKFFVDALPPREEAPPKPKRPSFRKFKDPHLKALAQFAYALQDSTPSERRASINWLASRFLGE